MLVYLLLNGLVLGDGALVLRDLLEWPQVGGERSVLGLGGLQGFGGRSLGNDVVLLAAIVGAAFAGSHPGVVNFGAGG